VYTSYVSGGALLDPHIDGNHVYVPERSNSSFSTLGWTVWSVDDIPVTWANPPTGGSATLYTPTLAGYWPTWAQGSPHSCEQYYKATSFQHLTNGYTRIFTQANQVRNYLS
jgi:hypothetical protein